MVRVARDIPQQMALPSEAVLLPRHPGAMMPFQQPVRFRGHPGIKLAGLRVEVVIDHHRWQPPRVTSDEAIEPRLDSNLLDRLEGNELQALRPHVERRVATALGIDEPKDVGIAIQAQIAVVRYVADQHASGCFGIWTFEDHPGNGWGLLSAQKCLAFRT